MTIQRNSKITKPELITMAPRLMNGWQWPLIDSNNSSDDSDQGDPIDTLCPQYHTQHNDSVKTRRNRQRPRPHRSNATTVMPKSGYGLIRVCESETDLEVLEQDVHFHVDGSAAEQALMRWRLAALTLVLIVLVEAVLLCFVVYWHPCARLHMAGRGGKAPDKVP